MRVAHGAAVAVPPRRLDYYEVFSWIEGPRNAAHRGEVARSSGLAAALDEYEHAPHGASTVDPADAVRTGFPDPFTMRDVRTRIRDRTATLPP